VRPAPGGRGVTGARGESALSLFEQALDRPAEERIRFVEDATGSDPALRARVLAMLRADSEPHPILDPTDGRPGAAGSDPASPLEGRRIGPYTVIREIGRGGMATVCLASDPKHRRSVALKLLNAEASSALGSERFRREIEVVARLQHPHILPLYDSGEWEGRLFYVMPVVQGESLRERIARQGPLPVPMVRRITAEVGAALDYAHRQGVIHRDVKPANILLDDEHASLADFGIAHLARDDSDGELTTTGVIVGTPAFISPEQVLSEDDADARSDVYSLGCVVFTMLTGGPPFRADTAPGLLAQHLQAPVPSVRTARPELGPAVDEVLRRALSKERAGRYGSVREMVASLDGALAGGGDRRPGARTRVRAPAVALLVATMVVLGLLAGRFLGGGDRAGGGAIPSIAVLPFTNLSGDPADEYFSDGMTEELTGALAQLGRIRVTPRTTAFAYKGRTGDLTRIGAELAVSRLLEGSVRRDANRVLVRASLYDAATGDLIWTDQYERDWGSMLALQAEIAGAIVEQLQLTLLPGERARLAGRHTPNADAYDSYLRGRYFFDVRTAASLEQAVIHFRRALAIDSMYARAHAGLADSYSILAWTGSGVPTQLFAAAEGAARHALTLDSTLAEAHVSLAIIETFHRWNWAAADRATTRAIGLDSALASAWFFRAWHLVAQGRRAEAMAAIERARALEPLSLINNARVGTMLTWAGRLEAADSVLGRTLEIDPTYPVARVQRARVLSLQGRHAEAIGALPPDSVRLGSFEAGIAGFVYARAGRREAALTAVRALEARDYAPAEGIAAIYAGLGDIEAALGWLERAVEARGTGLIFLAAEPMYAPLRGHPRFRLVLERIGLES
ncbi:MAG TPA: protein kinase, partial [Gemmatimonadales bacterium]|nr:protein kinase [Gemmatimonadales bacterium]